VEGLDEEFEEELKENQKSKYHLGYELLTTGAGRQGYP
jgi:hypothetical protein